MNLDVETEVRTALAARAAEVPAGAGDRLRAAEYRPRTRRFPSRPAVGVAGVAAVGTAVSIAVFGGAQPAFAGWNPKPVQTVNAPSTAAASACAAQLAAMPSLPGSTDNGPWTPIATDVRGPFTVVVYQDGSDFTTCFSGPPFTVVNRSSVSKNANGTISGSGAGGGTGLARGGWGSQSVTRGAGDIEESSVAHLTSASDGPYTLVEGQIESDVTGLTLVTANGQDVQATTGNGWFIAWWPGSADVASVQVTTPSGTHSQPLGTPAPAPAPPAPSGGQPSSGASSGGSSSSGSASG